MSGNMKLGNTIYGQKINQTVMRQHRIKNKTIKLIKQLAIHYKPSLPLVTVAKLSVFGHKLSL